MVNRGVILVSADCCISSCGIFFVLGKGRPKGGTKITTFIRKGNIPQPGCCTGKEAFHLYLTLPSQWASLQPFRILLCSAPFPPEFSHKPAFSVYCVCESLHPLNILLSTPYKLSSKPPIIVYLGLWIYKVT